MKNDLTARSATYPDRARRTISASRPSPIERLEECQQSDPRLGSGSEGCDLKLKLVRRIKAGHMLLAIAARLAKAREKRKTSGLEFLRRIAAVFIFSIRTAVFTVAVSVSSLSSAATLSVQSEMLCSPEGLMRLVPHFSVNGQFTIPDPNADLQTFLSAQQGLSNAIDMILAQENISQNPSDVGSLPSRPLIFASNWLSSEVGIQTDGTNLSSPEAGGKFGGYRVQSFLTGLLPCLCLREVCTLLSNQTQPIQHLFIRCPRATLA